MPFRLTVWITVGSGKRYLIRKILFENTSHEFEVTIPKNHNLKFGSPTFQIIWFENTSPKFEVTIPKNHYLKFGSHTFQIKLKPSGLNNFFQNRPLFRPSAGTAKFSKIYLPFTILDRRIKASVHKCITYTFIWE